MSKAIEDFYKEAYEKGILVKRNMRQTRKEIYSKLIADPIWQESPPVYELLKLIKLDFAGMDFHFMNNYGNHPYYRTNTNNIDPFKLEEFKKYMEKIFFVRSQTTYGTIFEHKEIPFLFYMDNGMYGNESTTIMISNDVKNREIYEKVVKDYTENFMEIHGDDKPKFKMVCYSASQGYYLTDFDCLPKPIKGDRFDLFYGKKFPYKEIQEFFTSDEGNLMLLHGDPGTGKSNLIKTLLADTSKEIIYVPPNLLSMISSPEFITFMMHQKGKCLLIEDAEQILSKDRNSATNNLLGMTDGFLKDALDMKVICTFNTGLHAIDDALFRKGRLYMEYKFDKLSQQEAQELADFCELNITIDKESSLAEIFSQKENRSSQATSERSIADFFKS